MEIEPIKSKQIVQAHCVVCEKPFYKYAKNRKSRSRAKSYYPKKCNSKCCSKECSKIWNAKQQIKYQKTYQKKYGK